MEAEAETAPAASLDRLPPEVLDMILRRLQIHDVVCTSALSRAWRHLWESVPGICFFWSITSGIHPAAVDAVLARYACPVSDFRYWGVSKVDSAHADRWVALLAGRGVHTLLLRFHEFFLAPRRRHTLHPAVFSCRELTSLILSRCNLPAAPPGFEGFPRLTLLSHSTFGLPENGVRELEATIRMSPLLQTLGLDNVSICVDDDEEEWAIQAPCLRKLTIVSFLDFGWQIPEELPLLQEAQVRTEEYSSDRDFVQLLTALAHVSKLDLSMPLFTEDNALEGLSCSFQKLESLTLHTNFCSASSILSTFSLLRSAPNLKTLEIEIVDNVENQDDEVDLDFFDELWDNGLFASLELVTMKDVAFLSNEMHFIEFVLSKARLLRAFYIHRDGISSFSKPSEEALIELLAFRRVSAEAKVFFRRMKSFRYHA